MYLGVWGTRRRLIWLWGVWGAMVWVLELDIWGAIAYSSSHAVAHGVRRRYWRMKMTRIFDLLRQYHSLPAGLHSLLQLAGFEEGADGLWLTGRRAADAPARWVGDWYEDDLAGPLERPDIRLCRNIVITGPEGVVTGVLMR